MNELKKTNKMKESKKRENLVEENIDICRHSELGTSDKIWLTGLNLHEIKIENLLD